MYRLISLIIILLIYGTNSTAQEKTSDRHKISNGLQSLINSTKDSIEVMVGFDELSFMDSIKKIHHTLFEYREANILLIRMLPTSLLTLMGKKEVVFADLLRKPFEELTTGAVDLTLNNVSLVHHLKPGFNGDSIRVSIKEQRFDTSDIDIKNRWKIHSFASPTSSTHASIMATIMAGGGNSSPFAKGVAWRALLSSSNFSTLLPDPDSIYQLYNVSVQNHSYGTGIENYYGVDAFAYDKNVMAYPFLLHVFSSGNSGTVAPASGAYSGITGNANLTGSFKMSKNTISAGATDSFNVVQGSSSRGPAYDGRVKPEIVAYGDGGSSGAAAIVSGAAGVLQQAFKVQNGMIPPAALIKAILLNSARDIANPYPDFISGFGSLDLNNALETFTQNRFFSGKISNGEEKNYSITIPANARQLKITIAWTDTSISANTTKALVNDIDSRLVFLSTGEEWKPWVLNSFPHKDSLSAIATRKTDTLNNVEQISIENPSAGNYLFFVKGSKILSNFQNFSFAYQADTSNSLFLTYPVKGSALESGKKHVVRWETNLQGTGTIEYSADGNNWQNISSTLDLSKKYYQWQGPTDQSIGFLRIRDNLSPTSSRADSFIISKALNLKVGYDCEKDFLLFWQPAIANNYSVYSLGDKYLETFTNLSDSFIVINKVQSPSQYYSVAPLIGGKPGLRSYTINYKQQGVQCFFKNFLAELQIDKAYLTTTLGTVYGVKKLSFQKLMGQGFQTIKEFLTPATLHSYTDSSLTKGVNTYRVMLTLSPGETVLSDEVNVYYFPGLPVIVYPNPVRQGDEIKFIVQENDEYSIEFFDVNGRSVYTRMLKDVSQSITAKFSKGIYFVKIVDRGGRFFTQKLLVF